MISEHAPLPRERLLEILESSRSVLLAAPTGFGKSALLRALRRRTLAAAPEIAPPVWVHLHRRVDAREFWHRVAEALPELRGVSRPDVLTRLRQAAEPVPLLGIDGVDLVPEAVVPEILDLVGSGAVTRLVAAGQRSSSAWSGAFASIAPVRIGADELRFTAAEIEDLLSRSADARDLTAPQDVESATGGWPALTMAFLGGLESLRSADAAGALVRETALAISVDLGDELGEGSALLRPLLLAEEFTLSLARQLSAGDVTLPARLESLLSRGLLVNSAPGQVYRWPSAVRIALGQAMNDAPSGVRAEAHSAISRWHEGRGEPARALQHAALAEDWRRAVSILEKNSRKLLFAHAYDELYETLNRIPLDVVETSPISVGLRDLWLRVPDSMLLAATRLPSSAEALTHLGRSRRAKPALEAGYVLLMALGRRGQLDAASAYAHKLIQIAEAARSAQPHEVLDLYPSLHLHAGILQLIAGNLDTGLNWLWRAYERAADNPRPYISADSASKTALAYAVLGDQHRARVWLQRHADAPLEAGYLDRRIRCTTNAAELLLAVDQLRVDEARGAYSRLLTADTNPEEIFWAYLAYAQAQYALLVGASADMLDQLQRVRLEYARWEGGGAIAGPLLDSAMAELLMALGRGNQARAVLRGRHADHSMMRVPSARLALLAGHPEIALHHASDSRWEERASIRQRVEMLLIKAVAARRTGELELAHDAVRRAADSARFAGTLFPFATVPRDELETIAANEPAAAGVLRDPALAAMGKIYPRSLSLADLTLRENEILERLATRLSLQQLATSLHLSRNTVKAHAHSLYRKLGVNSRDDAVARGREYGLL